MLINLSNHPYAKWSSAQKEAATTYGEAIDMPFPAVDADGDEDYLTELANEYVGKVKQLAQDKDATVHLMGEMTLTFSLLKRLQTAGFTCIASTTERCVTEIAPDQKEVIFRFVRFRRYE